jgi:ATP-dependent RNA helicase SUPV3L1/SUV3
VHHRGPRRDGGRDNRAPRGEGEAGGAPRAEGQRDPRREERNKRFEKYRRPEGAAPAAAAQVEGGEKPRFDKPRFDKRDERNRGGKPGSGKPGRDERNAAPRSFSDRKPEAKQADPDSPFAKLAALKAQLEGKN